MSTTRRKTKTKAKKKAKRPSRLQQFKDAHKWRLKFVQIARKQGLTPEKIRGLGTRSTVVKDLAAEVGVTYHTAWRFTRNALFAAYWEGKAPTPEQQLAAANVKARSSTGEGRLNGVEVDLDQIASELEEFSFGIKRLARVLRQAKKQRAPRGDLQRLLQQSLNIIEGEN